MTAPHGLTAPLLMDATVAQEDGYRFIYVLPFGPDVVLIEDTVYGDQPVHDEADIQEPGVPTIGIRAGLVHPTTGYSLPYAVRTADLIARAPTLTSAALTGPLTELARTTFKRQRFLRMLNRLLFRAADPAYRYPVLQKFYRLPEPTIARFYADRLTTTDKIRLLTGRPPVPIVRALSCLPERIES
jgi:lycopene beta-cyclase